jgi:hypothetical protein
VVLLVMGGHFPPLTQLRTVVAQIDTRIRKVQSGADDVDLDIRSSVPPSM